MSGHIFELHPILPVDNKIVIRTYLFQMFIICSLFISIDII